MKSSSEELHEYLTALDYDGLLEFCRRIKLRLPLRSFDNQIRYEPVDKWIEKVELADPSGRIIEVIHESKHSDPVFFDKTLRAATIRPDEGRSLALSDRANSIARQARWVAFLSALAAAASAVFAAWTYYKK